MSLALSLFHLFLLFLFLSFSPAVGVCSSGVVFPPLAVTCRFLRGVFFGRAFLSSREMALMSGRWCLLIFLVISVARVLDLYSFAANCIQWWYSQQWRSTPPNQRGSELESPSMHRRFPVNKISQTAENKRRLPLILLFISFIAVNPVPVYPSLL